jgi:hypothetical protein
MINDDRENFEVRSKNKKVVKKGVWVPAYHMQGFGIIGARDKM